MQNKIILSIVIFFAVSFFFLAQTERKQYLQSNQWFLSFENPTEENISFIIDNQDKKQNFHWEYWRDLEKITEGNLEIEKNSNQIIHINPIRIQEKRKNIIKVLTGEKEKEIYKIY
ncbi:MAG: hypothetical protein UR69_C0001G0110 [Candidatus Moranbacteria bacterium GW2011_GWE2_35_2-]|nr:MAG: hypothetical protein UR69_C0001G0110 [Candidatus Moranbacteria bacterium GW2011_GWE2_35_2-]KKQ06431.1 MAG: hypothetical protein US15_C0011G0011 [Candidatus Moranbacteria bacterium GW2011_GWF1_36_4]KKQ22892.1 MAG: hypothetical protein US37_C0001G0164 [Candidatus Moranbacteria bacterium GW2011_GWF2_37_11]KKQ29250.1 MAG: hypothetical protein US44_C0002G0032 [Candidatus Moranbacteria bacterium GW2011_GWD1_37_17]KKQ30877.1 MAG: hypothetical protein US47_C0001G0110 [Candidatus Moranbacteria b